MRGVVVERWMEPSELCVVDLDAPEVRPGTLGIEVRAAGCNFFDMLMVKGEYRIRPPFPFVPGAEVAGVVTEVGAGVDGFAVGDRVFGAPGLGGFAERAVMPAFGSYRLPDSMSFEEGAALPIIYPTSYMALVDRELGEGGSDRCIQSSGGSNIKIKKLIFHFFPFF